MDMVELCNEIAELVQSYAMHKEHNELKSEDWEFLKDIIRLCQRALLD